MFKFNGCSVVVFVVVCGIVVGLMISNKVMEMIDDKKYDEIGVDRDEFEIVDERGGKIRRRMDVAPAVDDSWYSGGWMDLR